MNQQELPRQRLWQFVDRLENALLVWTILGLAAVGFVQVFSRYLGNYSFTWYEELGRYLGVFVAFLGAATGVKTGSHFSMNLLVTHLPRPWQELLRASVAGLSGLFFFLVTFYAVKLIVRLHGFGNSSPSLGLPMYLVYLPIPLFSLLAGSRFLAIGLKELRALRCAPALPGQGEHR